MDYPIGENVLEGGRECRCHNGGGKRKRSYEGHIHCVTEANGITRADTERRIGRGVCLMEIIWAARMSV